MWGCSSHLSPFILRKKQISPSPQSGEQEGGKGAKEGEGGIDRLLGWEGEQTQEMASGKQSGAWLCAHKLREGGPYVGVATRGHVRVEEMQQISLL